MSCSWAHESKMRNGSRSRTVPGPAGVHVSAEKPSSVMARRVAMRSPVTSRNSSSTSGPVRARRASTQTSFDLPMSFFTWGKSGAVWSGGGRPMITDSMPMMWATLSCTLHPGHSVSVFHSASLSPAQSSSIDFHSSSSASTSLWSSLMPHFSRSWPCGPGRSGPGSLRRRFPAPRSLASGYHCSGPRGEELEQLVDVVAEGLDECALLTVGGELDLVAERAPAVGECVGPVDPIVAAQAVEGGVDLVRGPAHPVGGGRARVGAGAPPLGQELDLERGEPSGRPGIPVGVASALPDHVGCA